jgi:hypothetical protein
MIGKSVSAHHDNGDVTLGRIFFSCSHFKTKAEDGVVARATEVGIFFSFH